MASLRQIPQIDSTFPLDEDDSSSLGSLLKTYYENNENELQSVLKTERQNLFANGQNRSEILFSQKELESSTNEVLNSDTFLQECELVDFSDITNLGQSKKDEDEDVFIYPFGVSCEECITYEKVQSITQISPGDHIRFHRRFVGLNVYNHHAIVTGVTGSEKVGKLTLIHFQRDKTRTITVVRDTKEYNFETNEIDIVIHKLRPFTPEQIVERANEMADKFEQGEHAESYNVLGNNCEDKSNEIATGSNSSNQVSSIGSYVKSSISWLFMLMLKVAIKFCKRITPVIRGFTNISVIASLLSIVDRMAILKDKLKNGLMCLKCYKKEQRQMMISLIFCLISIGISVTCNVSGFYFAVSTAVAVALPFVASNFTDLIITLIQPSSKIPKPLVKQSDTIRKGEVITFPYIGLNHEGVVTSVSPYDAKNVQEVKLTLVHFNYPGLFAYRTVVKEEFVFNLKKDYVYVYDFSQENPFQSQEVVKRALSRCGDKNFSPFSNRSSHLSRHCKTGKTESKTLPYKKAKSITDFSPGDVVNFTYYNLPHDAVVVKIEYPEVIKCSVVHYNYAGVFGTRTIVEEDFIFKLADQNVFVHKYTEGEIYQPEEVVRRAKSRLGEQKFNTFTKRSSHFAKYCKMKQ